MKSINPVKIAIVTLAAGEQYKSEVALGIENKREYCREHGYDFILAEESLDASRHIYWSKLCLVLKALEDKRYDWVVSVDADTLIMNQNIRLEDFLDERYHFIISEDINGINSGIYFIKNCPWSHAFIKSVYARTDCDSHKWQEQEAIALELQKLEWFVWTKVTSQRLFNSYPQELFQGPTITYEPGDFILHMASASWHGSETVQRLLQKYAPAAVSCKDPLSVDVYLGKQGFRLSPISTLFNKSYITEAQRQQFQVRLSKLPQIQTIALIGLNTGHAAECFFNCCVNLRTMISFDSDQYAYTRFAADFLSEKYKTRFEFIEGEILEKISEYITTPSSQKFDLIYIADVCAHKLHKCTELAHKDTLIWVDEYHTAAVQEAIHSLRADLQIEKIHTCEDRHGVRSWVELRYK